MTHVAATTIFQSMSWSRPGREISDGTYKTIWGSFQVFYMIYGPRKMGWGSVVVVLLNRQRTAHVRFILFFIFNAQRMLLSPPAIYKWRFHLVSCFSSLVPFISIIHLFSSSLSGTGSWGQSSLRRDFPLPTHLLQPAFIRIHILLFWTWLDWGEMKKIKIQTRHKNKYI